MPTSPRSLAARALAAVLLVPTAVLASTQTAFAGTATMHDDTGDTYFSPSLDSAAPPVRQPGSLGDVVSVRTAHQRTAVTVTIHARELSPALNVGAVVLQTSAHRLFSAAVGAVDGRQFAVLATGRKGTRTVKCAGLRMRVDLAADTVAVILPRTCLGSPRWVRTGAILMSSADPSVPDGAQLSDVAGVNAPGDALWSSKSALPPLGPKVRVG